MGLRDLPTMADVAASRRGPIAKGPTRLNARTADTRDEKAAEKAWRKGCIARDGKVCRVCKRKVVAQLALAPERLEVHHLASRRDKYARWQIWNGIVLCCECHGKLTRHKLFPLQHAKDILTSENGTTYIDAGKPIEFKEKAA